MASIFKRGNSGTWFIKYYINGQQVYRSMETKNERIALQIKKQVEADETKGIPEPSSTPIRTFLQALCEYWKKTRKSKGAASDIGRLRLFFGPACPAYPPRTQKKFKDNPRTGPKRRVPKTGAYVPIKRLEDLTPTIITAILRERFLTDGISGKTAACLP